MTLFFITFSSILFLVYFYTGFRLIPSIFKGKKRWAAWTILFALFLIPLLHLYLRMSLTHYNPMLSAALAWPGYTGLGFVTILFWLVFARDLLIIPPAIIKKLDSLLSKDDKPDAIKPYREKKLANPGRRSFLFTASSYSIVAVSGSATLAGTCFARQKPKIVQVDVPLPEKLKNLAGLKLVQFTDLHAGPTIQYDFIDQVAETIKSLNPHIITFTGDIADATPEELTHDLSPLSKLDAPYGKFFVTGNHEYYSGVGKWIKYAENIGFQVLLNEHKIIEHNNGRLCLAGVTDIQGGQFYPHHKSDPIKAIQGSPDKSYKILLAHHPASVYQSAEAGFDLQLSGHTHGGQYFPFQYFIPLDQPYVKGMYKHDKTLLYVSQGTGYWGPPLRLGTFPEVTLFKFI